MTFTTKFDEVLFEAYKAGHQIACEKENCDPNGVRKHFERWRAEHSGINEIGEEKDA